MPASARTGYTSRVQARFFQMTPDVSGPNHPLAESANHVSITRRMSPAVTATLELMRRAVVLVVCLLLVGCHEGPPGVQPTPPTPPATIPATITITAVPGVGTA